MSHALLAIVMAKASSPLSVSASPIFVNGIGGGFTLTPVTSDSTTATASGGTGPYTYAWTRLSGSTSITADIPSNATTTFSSSGNVAVGATLTATFRVTATDALSATATFDVPVELTN